MAIERPYPCPKAYCSKSFHRKSDLQRHESVHTGKRSHHCPMCDKSFAQYAGLKTHLNTHTGAKPFRCNYDGCRSAFSDPSSRTRHRKETHEMTGTYVCPFSGCGSSIKRKATFVQHLFNRHPSEHKGVDVESYNTARHVSGWNIPRKRRRYSVSSNIGRRNSTAILVQMQLPSPEIPEIPRALSPEIPEILIETEYFPESTKYWAYDCALANPQPLISSDQTLSRSASPLPLQQVPHLVSHQSWSSSSSYSPCPELVDSKPCLQAHSLVPYAATSSGSSYSSSPSLAPVDNVQMVFDGTSLPNHAYFKTPVHQPQVFGLLPMVPWAEGMDSLMCNYTYADLPMDLSPFSNFDISVFA